MGKSRMKWRVFTWLAIVSLIMCVIQIALWVRSHRDSDWLSAFVDRHDRHLYDLYRIQSRRACFIFSVERPSTVSKGPFYQSDRISRTTFFSWKRSGFEYVHYDRTWVWSAPQWIFICLSGVMPLIWTVYYIRHRRPQGDFCASCGYDLRGTLAAGRSECPECGRPIEAKANK